jgi:hypothetical protein
MHGPGPCRPACTDDAHGFVFGLHVCDDDQSAIDGTDGDEAIFLFGMCFIEDLQVLIASGEQGACFLERNIMLAAVLVILGVIPNDSHLFLNLRAETRGQSMT